MTNPVTPVTISPTIVDRPAQQYVGTTRTVTMTSIGLIADRLPEILDVLLGLGQAPAGPPFLRYLAIRDDMSELEVEAGWPVASGVDLSAGFDGLARWRTAGGAIRDRHPPRSPGRPVRRQRRCAAVGTGPRARLGCHP
jgi:hypothetical protein